MVKIQHWLKIICPKIKIVQKYCTDTSIRWNNIGNPGVCVFNTIFEGHQEVNKILLCFKNICPKNKTFAKILY